MALFLCPTRSPWTMTIRLVAVGLCLLAATATQAGPAHPAATSKGAVTNEGTFLKTLPRVPPPGQDWRVAQDRFGRFALALPPEWDMQSPDNYGDNYNLVAGETAARDNFAANLLISQETAPEGFTLKPDFVEKYSRRLASDMKRYKYVLKDKGFTKLDGLACVVVGGTMDVNGRQVRNVQMRVIHRGVSYLMTFTSLERYYAQYEPVFARIARTIVFERPGGPPPQPLPSPSPARSPSPQPSPSAHPGSTPATGTPAPSPSSP